MEEPKIGVRAKQGVNGGEAPYKMTVYLQSPRLGDKPQKHIDKLLALLNK